MSRPSRPLPGLTGPGRRARWRRRVLRRLVSAVLAVTAVLLVVAELRPPAEPVTAALVAARHVPAGAVLVEADLRVDHVPRGAVQPGGLTTVPDAVHRRVGASLARGESVTASRLVPRGVLDGLPAGRVAMHVVASDPSAVDLLAPGMPARVYPAAGGPPLAGGASVLSADPPQPGGPASLTDAPPRGVVLSLSAGEADAVLAGHGSLEGPVTVSVVAAPG
jgi:pilus assembly protein CpaB